jgi:nucleotide-binding universal stress UspA family protein
MKNILVPFYSLDKPSCNLQYAIDFARHINAKVRVVSIYSELGVKRLPKELSIKEIKKNDIEAYISKTNTTGVEVKALPLEGDDLNEAIGLYNQKQHVDLLVITPKSHSVNSELYLGQVSGSMVKRNKIPTIIVPKDYVFTPIKRILTAVKTGVLKDKRKVSILAEIKNAFEADLRLLLVKTPDYKEKYGEIDTLFTSMMSNLQVSENATVFQGVLEHLKENDPDMLCVFTRKRGFFAKLWDDDTVKKIDFESRIPLLVLKGNQ